MTAISPTDEQAPAAAPLVGRPDVNRKRMARLGWMFAAPALLIVAGVTIFPIVYSVVISLSNAQVSGNGISLNGFTTANYSLVLKNSTWHYALGFTIIYTLVTVVFRVLQAFGLFDLPYVLTNGGPGTATTSLAILGYNAIFKNLSFGPGAAVATTTALLVLLGCLLSLRTFRVQVGKEGD